jgi:FdrA protein
MPVWNFVWRSAYHDSVTLMRLTHDMEAVPGVKRAAAMMGTPQNRALLEDAGLLADGSPDTAPADLLIAVAADDEAAARGAEAAARAALLARPSGTRPGLPGASAHRPRTLASALRALPDASLALISVPGLYAAAEAMKALRAGLHVMLFSDNVPVEAEIELKRLALSRGLFVMGPDCGTALIDGVPLGFANAVPRGRIGVAAASGTGLQEVSTLVARHGEGISHGIGVGGRDLSDAVGGLMMSRALEVLAEDPATEVICVIGKPPGAAVAARLAREAARLGKPCVVHFVGSGSGSLEECARAAVAQARKERSLATELTLPATEVDRLVAEAGRGLGPAPRFVRGVYAGGTLAWEARSILAAALPDVAPDVTAGAGANRVVDLGEDMFTVGRPHPMIDGTVRREWIARETAEPGAAVLLLDVILGYGAHPDPAGELIPALERARVEARAQRRGLAVVASVVGTEADPQGRAAQVAKLAAHGVLVMPSNAQAARLAARIARVASS